jgi:DNA-binding IclR family transcriptional regulator
MKTRRTAALKPGGAARRGSVQAVTIAARILSSLAARNSAAPLKEIAKDTGLARAKVHRYLRSLRNTGLVSQDDQTGRYQLGPQAIGIGLAALRSINPIAEVCNALPWLRDEINQTVTAAVWSDAGPVLVAMQESDHWLTMNIRVGSRLPILTTAIGWTFLAHLPEPAIRSALSAERRRAQSSGAALPSPEDTEHLVREIRKRRLARAPSAIIPGIDAVAAPVFDFRNDLVAVICVVARSDAKITGWNGSAVRALSATAEEVSSRLGFKLDDQTSGRPHTSSALEANAGHRSA